MRLLISIHQMGRSALLLLVAGLLPGLLSACQPAARAAAPEISALVQGTALPGRVEAIPTAIEITPTEPVREDPSSAKITPSPTSGAAANQENTVSANLSTATPTLAWIKAHSLSPEMWKSWPVIPQVPETARQIYQKGLALGNDPHAFSILGDCQSLPETFLGVYDTDPERVASLPPDLQQVVNHFAGSFNRASPTVKGGTTAGAVLWTQWHENAYTCWADETPLACELRLHKPSIVIINLGTHYETRNINYLRKILDQLIAQGVVPILSTKADNRELDERLNMEMALLAVEYNLPLWNFYAAVEDLPNHGVGIKEGEEHLGEIYLSEEGLERHRYTALQALAAVWRAVQAP